MVGLVFESHQASAEILRARRGCVAGRARHLAVRTAGKFRDTSAPLVERSAFRGRGMEPMALQHLYACLSELGVVVAASRERRSRRGRQERQAPELCGQPAARSGLAVQLSEYKS